MAIETLVIIVVIASMVRFLLKIVSMFARFFIIGVLSFIFLLILEPSIKLPNKGSQLQKTVEIIIKQKGLNAHKTYMSFNP